MQIEYHCEFSDNLGQEVAFKVYGHAGKPVIVFPSSGGSFYEYEDFGMVDACRTFLEAGSIQLFTADSVDGQSWMNHDIPHAQRAARHEAFERYILHELTPYIRARTAQEKLMATGCSLGAFHTVNFLLKYPGVFDTAIALSGVYTLHFSVGDYMDESLYFHSPLHYLPHLSDPAYLEPLRRSSIVICSGQGAWEEETLRDTYALKELLAAKDIPAWVDIWGTDVVHDWPWWRQQMPYFLDKLGYRS